MPNLAALRAAIFLLSAKNRWGGGHICAPPPAVRGLIPSSVMSKCRILRLQRKGIRTKTLCVLRSVYVKYHTADKRKKLSLI